VGVARHVQLQRGYGGYVQVSDATARRAPTRSAFEPGAAPPPPTEVILDNMTAGQSDANRSFTGTWTTSTSAGAYGSDSLYSSGPGRTPTGGHPTFRQPERAGLRQVDQPCQPKHKRAIDVVHTAEGRPEPSTNRSAGGLGCCTAPTNFNAGTAGYVETDDSFGQACADAVRFVKD